MALDLSIDQSEHLSGVYTGNFIFDSMSSRDHSFTDVDVLILIIFAATDHSFHTYSVEAISIDDKEQEVWIMGGIYCISTNMLELHLQCGKFITSMNGEMSQNCEMSLESLHERHSLHLIKAGNIITGICKLLSIYPWSGTCISGSQIFSLGHNVSLHFAITSNDSTLISVSNRERVQIGKQLFLFDGMFDTKTNIMKLQRIGDNNQDNLSYIVVFNPVKLEFDGRGKQSIHLRSNLLKQNACVSKLPNLMKRAIHLVSTSVVQNPKKGEVRVNKAVSMALTAFRATEISDTHTDPLSTEENNVPEILPLTEAVTTVNHAEITEVKLTEDDRLHSFSNVIHSLIRNAEIAKGLDRTFDEIYESTLITEQQHNVALSLYSLLRDKSPGLLEVQGETLRDTDLCRLCYASVIDCVLIPCGHLAVCYVCSVQLEVCPYDRTRIQKVQQIFRV